LFHSDPDKAIWPTHFFSIRQAWLSFCKEKATEKGRAGKKEKAGDASSSFPVAWRKLGSFLLGIIKD